MTSGHYCDGCAQAYYKCVCNKQEEKIIPKKMNERIQELAEQATSIQGPTPYNPLTFEVFDKEKFAKLIIEECAREVEEFARKWWSIHCHSNKHAETTRKAHDDFCALQRAIRRRGKTV